MATTIADWLTYMSQQNHKSTIATCTKLTYQLNYIGNQSVFISTTFWTMSLHRAMLHQNPTGLALLDSELALDMINTSTITSETQRFPRAASFKITLSRVKLDTARVSCSLSFCRRFSAFNWSLSKLCNLVGFLHMGILKNPAENKCERSTLAT